MTHSLPIQRFTSGDTRACVYESGGVVINDHTHYASAAALFRNAMLPLKLRQDVRDFCRDNKRIIKWKREH